MSDGSSAPGRNEAGCDVFVSYAREDHAVATRLVDYLESYGRKLVTAGIGKAAYRGVA